MPKRLLFAATTTLLIALSLTAPAALQQKPAAPAAVAAATPEYGPAKGTLVIVGGGATEGTGIMEKFIELGGGPDGSSSSCRPPAAIGTGTRDHALRRAGRRRRLAQARRQERQDAAHARSEGGRHRGVRERSARGRRGLVQRRPSVEHRRFLRRHADVSRVPQGARARRRHRRQFGRRDDSGPLPRARRHVGPERDDDRGEDAPDRVRLPAQDRRSTSTSTRAIAGTI